MVSPTAIANKLHKCFGPKFAGNLTEKLHRHTARIAPEPTWSLVEPGRTKTFQNLLQNLLRNLVDPGPALLTKALRNLLWNLVETWPETALMFLLRC